MRVRGRTNSFDKGRGEKSAWITFFYFLSTNTNRQTIKSEFSMIKFRTLQFERIRQTSYYFGRYNNIIIMVPVCPRTRVIVPSIKHVLTIYCVCIALVLSSSTFIRDDRYATQNRRRVFRRN